MKVINFDGSGRFAPLWEFAMKHGFMLLYWVGRKLDGNEREKSNDVIYICIYVISNNRGGTAFCGLFGTNRSARYETNVNVYLMGVMDI